MGLPLILEGCGTICGPQCRAAIAIQPGCGSENLAFAQGGWNFSDVSLAPYDDGGAGSMHGARINYVGSCVFDSVDEYFDWTAVYCSGAFYNFSPGTGAAFACQIVRGDQYAQPYYIIQVNATTKKVQYGCSGTMGGCGLILPAPNYGPSGDNIYYLFAFAGTDNYSLYPNSSSSLLNFAGNFFTGYTEFDSISGSTCTIAGTFNSSAICYPSPNDPFDDGP